MYPGFKVARSFFEPSKEVDSIFGEGFLVSTSDKEFEFDDQVIDSPAYRRAFIAATQNSHKTNRSQQIIDGDLLDLGLTLVDLSEAPEGELPPEVKKDSHGLDLLMLPIGEEEASKLDKPFSQALQNYPPDLNSASTKQGLGSWCDAKDEEELSKSVPVRSQTSLTSVEESLCSKSSSVSIPLVSEGHNIHHRMSPSRASKLSKPLSKAVDEEEPILVPKTAALKKPTYLRKKITANERIRHLDTGVGLSRTSFPHAFEDRKSVV